MFKTALVALDLAPAEQPIVDCLPALQAWGVERVVLVHVVQVGYMQGAALYRQADYWTGWKPWPAPGPGNGSIATPHRTIGYARNTQGLVLTGHVRQRTDRGGERERNCPV